MLFDNGQKIAILIWKLSNRAQVLETQQKTVPMGRFVKLGSAYLAVIEQSFLMSLLRFLNKFKIR